MGYFVLINYWIFYNHMNYKNVIKCNEYFLIAYPFAAFEVKKKDRK